MLSRIHTFPPTSKDVTISSSGLCSPCVPESSFESPYRQKIEILSEMSSNKLGNWAHPALHSKVLRDRFESVSKETSRTDFCGGLRSTPESLQSIRQELTVTTRRVTSPTAPTNGSARSRAIFSWSLKRCMFSTFFVKPVRQTDYPTVDSISLLFAVQAIAHKIQLKSLENR